MAVVLGLVGVRAQGRHWDCGARGTVTSHGGFRVWGYRGCHRAQGRRWIWGAAHTEIQGRHCVWGLWTWSSRGCHQGWGGLERGDTGLSPGREDTEHGVTRSVTVLGAQRQHQGCRVRGVEVVGMSLGLEELRAWRFQGRSWGWRGLEEGSNGIISRTLGLGVVTRAGGNWGKERMGASPGLHHEVDIGAGLGTCRQWGRGPC